MHACVQCVYTRAHSRMHLRYIHCACLCVRLHKHARTHGRTGSYTHGSTYTHSDHIQVGQTRQIGDAAIAFYNQFMPGTKKNLELKSRVPSPPASLAPPVTFVTVGACALTHSLSQLPLTRMYVHVRIHSGSRMSEVYKRYNPEFTGKYILPACSLMNEVTHTHTHTERERETEKEKLY